MCDHFFNFCVTAHSIRDWVIHSQNAPRQAVHDRCNRVEVLPACRDIANAGKHFALNVDRTSVARGAVVCRSSAIDVFDDGSGNYHVSEVRLEATSSQKQGCIHFNGYSPAGRSLRPISYLT